VVATSVGGWFVSQPDDLLSADEAQRALESLSPELREVVTLRLWGDLTLSEIAEITEVAVSTVHNRYTAAVELLREKLEIPCKNPKS
jgi:RNA polymerase sigma-70 factor (ECF subfamily)